MSMTTRGILLGCIGLVAMTLLGCSDGRPQRVEVSGRVLIDGRPIRLGFIRLIPPNDRAAVGNIDGEGRFTLTTYDEHDGCVPGMHVAEVIAVEVLNASSQRWHAPKKYANAETSGVRVQIDEATDDLVVELTWDGGEPFVERFGRDEELTEEQEGLAN